MKLSSIILVCGFLLLAIYVYIYIYIWQGAAGENAQKY